MGTHLKLLGLIKLFKSDRINYNNNIDCNRWLCPTLHLLIFLQSNYLKNSIL